MTDTPASQDLSGTWRAHEAHGALVGAFYVPGFDDGSWPEIAVPDHWRSHDAFATSDGPVLYRRRFDAAPAPSDARRFLVLDGAFYFADAWLDGDYLGATEGYFFPHSLEVTHTLRTDQEHELAIEVACPRQRDHTAKRIVTGVFSHWDNLDRAWNPGGLWRPVRLVTTGPVRITRARVLCVEATSARGRLLVDVTLDAGQAPRGAHLACTLRGPDGSVLDDTRRELTLAAGDNHLTLTLATDDPPRWWTWRLGDQPLCNVDLAIEVDGMPSDSRAWRSAFREVRMRNWRMSVNGEPIFPMGSNQGPNRMALARATPHELRRDVELAVESNLDLLRIHAHVSRPELYEAADELGLLLWQDFPLQWGYARAVRRPAVAQALSMVDTLGHHPSIAVWCAHNEPLAVDLQPGAPFTAGAATKVATSMLLPTWNKEILDFSISHTLRRADPTRTVIPHSGVWPGLGSTGTDSHFYFGWYHGRLDGLGPALRRWPRVARFVTEFGAQAVPERADFMQPERWPDLDWDQLFEHHACQKRIFNRHVPPARFRSFDAWRDATQQYQAALIQLQVEDLRRLKFAPTGGFCHFCFADGHPAVTWSVLDHERVPKAGYRALRDACRSVLPMVEPREGLVHTANEGRRALDGATLEVHADGRRLARWVGTIGADAVTFVGRVDLPPDAREVRAVLEHPATGTIENRYGAVVLAAIGRSPVRRRDRRRR